MKMYKDEGKWKWTNSTVQELTKRADAMQAHVDALRAHIEHVREVVTARAGTSEQDKLNAQIAKLREKLAAAEQKAAEQKA